jgi:hypothetical protein
MVSTRFTVGLVAGFAALVLAACTATPAVGPTAAPVPAPDGDWIFLAGTDVAGSFFADSDAPAHIVLTDGTPIVYFPCVTVSFTPGVSPCAESSERFADAVADSTTFALDGGGLIATGTDDLELRFAPAPVVDRLELVGSWTEDGSKMIETGPNTLIIAEDGSISGHSQCLPYTAKLATPTALLVTETELADGACAWGETDSFRDALDDDILLVLGGGAFPTLSVLSPGVHEPHVFEHRAAQAGVLDVRGEWELIAASDSSGDLESTQPISFEITDEYLQGTDGCRAIGTRLAPHDDTSAFSDYFTGGLAGMTLNLCMPAVEDFAQRYLDALNATQTAQVIDGVLALRSPGVELLYLPKSSK